MSSKYLVIFVFLLLAPLHALAEPATTPAKPAEAPAKSAVSPAKSAASSAKPAANIYESAVQCLGKEMWGGYGLSAGTLGCAAALSNVLNRAGYKPAHSATVTVLRKQLLAISGVREIVVKHVIEPLDLENLRLTAKRGDVLMAFMEPPTRLNGGPNAHCGIMGDECRVYTNNWNTGIWCVAPYETFFYYYKDVRLLRFEDAGGTAGK
jgi:hypothetical protein